MKQLVDSENHVVVVEDSQDSLIYELNIGFIVYRPHNLPPADMLH